MKFWSFLCGLTKSKKLSKDKDQEKSKIKNKTGDASHSVRNIIRTGLSGA